MTDALISLVGGVFIFLSLAGVVKNKAIENNKKLFVFVGVFLFLFSVFRLVFI